MEKMLPWKLSHNRQSNIDIEISIYIVYYN